MTANRFQCRTLKPKPDIASNCALTPSKVEFLPYRDVAIGHASIFKANLRRVFYCSTFSTVESLGDLQCSLGKLISPEFWPDVLLSFIIKVLTKPKHLGVLRRVGEVSRDVKIAPKKLYHIGTEMIDSSEMRDLWCSSSLSSFP